LRFWDSSALIPLLVVEPHTETVRRLTTEDPTIVVWWGTRVECMHAICRCRREDRIDDQGEHRARNVLEALAERWLEMQPTSALRSEAEQCLAAHLLKAADALQLAAAVRWSGQQPQGRDFVCLDGQLRTAARTEGFQVLPV
jgi:predicted nucleic acid-binding protein